MKRFRNYGKKYLALLSALILILAAALSGCELEAGSGQGAEEPDQVQVSEEAGESDLALITEEAEDTEESEESDLALLTEETEEAGEADSDPDAEEETAGEAAEEAGSDLDTEEADSELTSEKDGEEAADAENGVRYTEEGEEVPDFGTLKFRYKDRLDDHYRKHGIEMGFSSPEDYAAAANEVVHDDRALIKLEEEDGDYVFYIEETNDFVIVSRDGFLRTYFRPNGGKNYYLRQ